MNRLSSSLIAKTLTERYLLPLVPSTREVSEGVSITLTPQEIHPNEGFSIHILAKWRSISVVYVPGPYSAELIRALGYAPDQARVHFTNIAEKIGDLDGKITLRLNDVEQDPYNYADWPAEWSQFYLELKSPFIETDVDLTVSANANEEVITWAGRFLALIIELMPVEEEEISGTTVEELFGDVEGELTQIASRKYERSRRNRAACIAIHGSRCVVCGLKFDELYGDIGLGFIQVHHVQPLSMMHEQRIIDPRTDLIPVCPNCHAMLHKRQPPFSADELRDRINLE